MWVRVLGVKLARVEKEPVSNRVHTVGDAIRGEYEGVDQNGHGFSTADRDNDGCSPCVFGDIIQNQCTASVGGGWWYSRCGSAALNGPWHPSGDHMGWESGLHWLTWKSPGIYSVKASRMMLKSVEPTFDGLDQESLPNVEPHATSMCKTADVSHNPQ